ncbi:hypothetical protein ITP53_13300 [Nonomuraea sp. K274]|uniref:Lipoprotein n=1 Tax=Nonomuraea cypriaca TaxID=1187855 RepID=A0A931A8P0_9ACTN|nr:hypothetical protein [Nonomuraea cypriaca]MBF8186699.1 hypothetical protein [Nonomuraea cypriaca]
MRRMAILLALLAVAGCGQPERPYAPKEAPAPATSSAAAKTESPAPAEPAEDETAEDELPSGPQTVQVAENLRARIEWPTDPDPLLKVMVDQYVGTRKAVAEAASGYGHNMEIQAEAQATGWIREFAERDQSMRGIGRVYNLRVASARPKGAQINACIDETGIRLISASTGKAVARQPGWTRAPYPESVIVHRGDDGVWRIRTYLDTAERCTR